MREFAMDFATLATGRAGPVNKHPINTVRNGAVWKTLLNLRVAIRVPTRHRCDDGVIPKIVEDSLRERECETRRLVGACATDRREKRGAAVSDGALGGTGAESDCGDRIALPVKDAAKMLGVSISAMYEMIGKRQIGVLRLGDHCSIQIPNTEIERLLSENLVPALRV